MTKTHILNPDFDMRQLISAVLIKAIDDVTQRFTINTPRGMETLEKAVDAGLFLARDGPLYFEALGLDVDDPLQVLKNPSHVRRAVQNFKFFDKRNRKENEHKSE